VLLDLSRIRSGRDRIDRTFQPGDFADGRDEYEIVEPVTLGFDVLKDGTKFRLNGRVSTVLRLTCGRCLEGFRYPVDSTFDLLYLPQKENAGEGDIEVQDQDFATAFYQDDTIDLGQLLKEQFYLALPMKPLCTSGCRGLCPVCGTNLNESTCGCDTKWQDPRLAGLQSILDRGSESK
jgi:uncharacterized protein